MEAIAQFSNLLGTKAPDVCSKDALTFSQNLLEVKDVMSKEVVIISPEETVFSAAKRMSEKNVSCLTVIEDGTVVGILTEKDLLNGVAEDDRDFGNIRVAERMSCPVHTASPDLSTLEASRIMGSHKIKRLPVLADKHLVGIVTQTDLTRALTSVCGLRDVAGIMSTDVASVGAEATVAEAAQIMSSRSISCIIVTDRNGVAGILTEKDLLKRVIALHKDPTRTRVKDVMSFPVTSIPPSYSVFSAGRTMDTKHVHRLAVMEGKKLHGIVAQTDVFRAAASKVQQKREKAQQLLANSQSNIYVLDLDGKTTYVNPALMSLLEITDPEELIGQPFLPERFWFNPNERTYFLAELRKGDAEINELVLKTSSGKKIHVAVFSTFTKDIHGQVNGCQGILHNITDHNLAEQAAAQASDRLETANRELREMQSRLAQYEKRGPTDQRADGIAREANAPESLHACNLHSLKNHVNDVRGLLGMYDALAELIEASDENAHLLTRVQEIGQSREAMKIDLILEDIENLIAQVDRSPVGVTSDVESPRESS
jgi:PAS domain S-box-containing protein